MEECVARRMRIMEGETLYPTTGEVHLGAPVRQRGPLFSLPTELRHIIYQHVFGPSLIHVIALGERLAHVTCSEWWYQDRRQEHVHCRDEVRNCVRIEQSEDPNDQLSALLLTCRQMYVLELPFFAAVKAHRTNLIQLQRCLASLAISAPIHSERRRPHPRGRQTQAWQISTYSESEFHSTVLQLPAAGDHFYRLSTNLDRRM